MNAIPNRSTLPLALLAAAIATVAARAQVAVPPTMNYQGSLVDSAGNPLANGNTNVVFALYDAKTAGTLLWGPVTNPVAIYGGTFNTTIGPKDTQNRDLPSAAAAQAAKAGSPAFLEIGVGTTKIQPRQQLLSAPYAFAANTAGAVSGSHTVTAANLAPDIGLWTAIGDEISRPGITIKANGTIETGAVDSYSGLIEKAFAPQDRYGIGQLPNGTLALYTSASFGASSIQLGQMTGANSFAPQLTVDHSGNVSSVGTYFGKGISLSQDGACALILQVPKEDPGNAWAFFDGYYGNGNLGIARNIGGVWYSDRGLLINPSGNVGIGTIDPGRARLVVISGANGSQDSIGNHYQMIGTFVGPGGGFTAITSVYADHEVHAEAFRAFSDARIKSIRGRSDAASDLATLLGIEISDYTYRDVATHGTNAYKKAIAQQVETVFPQAVSRSTDSIPDLYTNVPVSAGWISLRTDLRPGERVRLVAGHDDDVHEVLEVRDGAFRTDFQPKTDKVFVYGREVKDFRTVDYEAISMLNVSATQELARRLEASRSTVTRLQAENAALEGKLLELESREAEQNDRLARLEKLVDGRAGALRAGLGKASPVSLAR